ncbi:hypothetical protein, partial [Rugosimonospora africana]|uniref:hypothetical protein n=1 Tax=Rugosimonospora africana TaxID=556532 RepID=UPI0019435DE4
MSHSSAIMLVMLELGEVSLTAAERALREAGLDPVVRDIPSHWRAAQPRGVWVRMPGGDAHAVVILTRVIPGDRLGTWHEADSRARGIVSGYGVNFFENVSRPHGHSWSGIAARAYSVFVDDIVAAVREWTGWESTWSVTPVVEPARKRDARLRRLAVSKLEGGALPVDIDIDPLMLSLLDAAQASALRSLLDTLFLPGIRWRFPRDRTGARLVNRGRVLLHECAPPAHSSGKGLWLAVDGPAPGTTPRLVVRLAHTAGRGAFHRWDRIPEYWRTGPHEPGARTLAGPHEPGARTLAGPHEAGPRT